MTEKLYHVLGWGSVWGVMTMLLMGCGSLLLAPKPMSRMDEMEVVSS